MSGPVPGESQKNVAHESGLEVVSPHYAAPEVFHPLASPPKQEGPNNVGAGVATQEGRICGLRRTTFWLSVTLLVVIIVAAVGGGVGGSIAVENARAATQSQSSSTSGPSPSQSSSSAALPTPTDALALNCPAIDGTTTTITVESTSYPFKVDCSQDINANNIISLVAYYFSDCMRACVGFNSESTSTSTGVSCKGVEFNTNLTYELQNNIGNCWLKSSSTTTGANSNYPDNSYAAAILQSTASG